MRDQWIHALAATVLLAAFTACAAGSGESSASTSSTSPSATPVTTTTPSPMPSAVPTPFAFSEDDVAIEPGTYRIPSSAWSLRDFTVTFPEGWSVQYGHVYHKHSDTEVDVSVYAVVVDAIHADACAGSGGEIMEVGPSVDDLGAALLQQSGPVASDPVETTLGGYRAIRVDLSIPDGFDLTSCNAADVGLQVWYSAPADKNLVLLRDEIMSVYIVDLDGQRQVFLAGRHAMANDDAQELQEVLNSIQIEPAPSPSEGSPAASPTREAVGNVTKHKDLAYGQANPGNLLDLYVPDDPGETKLPLVIWHSGSGFFANEVKDFGDDTAVVKEFTERGYAVASINIRSSWTRASQLRVLTFALRFATYGKRCNVRH